MTNDRDNVIVIRTYLKTLGNYMDALKYNREITFVHNSSINQALTLNVFTVL